MKDYFPPTIILRHRRENLKKCSLTGLEKDPFLKFYTYPTDLLPTLTSYVILDLLGPPIAEEDQGKGFILIDGTWNLAKKMEKVFPSYLERRSLPNHFKTAYPRRQTGCLDPSRGLSSVEALFILHYVLKRPCMHLLNHYYWKNAFLSLNF